MNKTTNCDDFLMALMARLDGEEIEFDAAAQAELHLAECAACRMEFEQMKNTDLLLKRQSRREQSADLWSAIEKRIEAETAPKTDWQPFLILGAFLVAYKMLEILPDIDFGFVLKLIPIAAAVVLFIILKENPFRINTKLITEE